MGQSDPTTFPANAASSFVPPISPAPVDPSNNGGYLWRYVWNAILIGLLVLSILGNVFDALGANGAWLGISDVAWHRILVVLAFATALYNAIIHAPPLTAPPTQSRLAVESQIHQLRKLV